MGNRFLDVPSSRITYLNGNQPINRNQQDDQSETGQERESNLSVKKVQSDSHLQETEILKLIMNLKRQSQHLDYYLQR